MSSSTKLHFNNIGEPHDCVQFGFCAVENDFTVSCLLFLCERCKFTVVKLVRVEPSVDLIGDCRLCQLDPVGVLVNAFVIVRHSSDHCFMEHLSILHHVTKVYGIIRFRHDLFPSGSVDDIDQTKKLSDAPVDRINRTSRHGIRELI